VTVLDGLVLISGSFGMGVLGGLLGVGGGAFLVPFLVFAAGLSAKAAVAVSLCCVIGTSASASAVGGRYGLARLELSLAIEPPLVIGAVAASAVLGHVGDKVVLVGFAALMSLIVVLMVIRRRRVSATAADSGGELSPGRMVAMATAALFSGAASGFFGVGGGVLVVPALVMIGRLPLKAATATSSLCLMTSAACGGMVHWSSGILQPDVVAASMVGVLPGGFLGARLQRGLNDLLLERIFVALAAIIIVWSLIQGLRA
jgi:uncharacterized membrane protein YfcA